MQNSKFVKSIGKTIEKIRLEKGMSLYKLSKETKLNYNHLKNIEEGNVDCYLRTIIKICEVLKISVVEFFECVD